VLRAYEAPQGDIENTVAELWSELLQIERVGRHDNFFELGGHSLLMVTLIQRMHRAGMKVDIRVFFGAPTIAGLAAALDSEACPVEVPANRIRAMDTEAAHAAKSVDLFL
jgi:aryl carrier-like protein